MNKDALMQARKIVERIVIIGDLFLETPTRFGNDDSNGVVDMTIARDPLEGHPLLPGASIAGALRSYLRVRESGFRSANALARLEKLLFGFEDGKGGSQSYLIVHDSLAKTAMTELRDGVAIDPKQRTAVDGKKYDLELLAAGTIFPLRLELLVVAEKAADLKEAVAIALQGFEQGEIPLGARRRRGFGKCRINGWRMWCYDLTKPTDLVAWLQEDEDDANTREQAGNSISTLLQQVKPVCDQRSIFALDALFGIAGSLLIRSSTEDPSAPDMIHLHSKRNGENVPIISGTSLAGALRARALRITKTMGNDDLAAEYIDDLFGPHIKDSNDIPRASRLWVEESVIQHPQAWVVSRVKLDRFTGGAFPTALFTQQPIFGVDETAVELRLRVQNPSDADKGLLLLLLKDLWTEDLPLGGEASVGRGRLRGKVVTMVSKEAGMEEDSWQIRQEDGRLTIEGDRKAMQACVDALWDRVKEKAQ